MIVNNEQHNHVYLIQYVIMITSACVNPSNDPTRIVKQHATFI